LVPKDELVLQLVDAVLGRAGVEADHDMVELGRVLSPRDRHPVDVEVVDAMDRVLRGQPLDLGLEGRCDARPKLPGHRRQVARRDRLLHRREGGTRLVEEHVAVEAGVAGGDVRQPGEGIRRAVRR